MAQADLVKLLQDYRTELSEKKGGERFRVSVPDIWEHRVVVSKPEIEKELRIQLAEFMRAGRKTGELGLSSEASKRFATQEEQELFLATQGEQLNASKISALADFYINNLADGFKSNRVKGYISEIERKGQDLLIIFRADPNSTPEKKSFIESIGRQGPVFANLGKVFSLSRLALNKQIVQKFKIKIDPRKETTFQVGHVTAVAQLRAGAVLSNIASKDVNALLGTLQFTGLSDLLKSQGELVKKFDAQIAYVKPQSAVANNLASKHDANILKQVRAAIESSLDEMLDRDWATQEGSNSLVEGIIAELVETATKSGAKVKGAKAKKDFSKSRGKVKGLSIEANLRSTTTKGGLGDIRSGIPVMTGPRVNIRSLIPMLNQRLPEIVRANMGINGRLVNRTGRFAESTEIVDIGDNNVITYTYQRYPYGVFESNNERDPRSLIDISIRELARGLITEKFTTRRV